MKPYFIYIVPQILLGTYVTSPAKLSSILDVVWASYKSLPPLES